MGEVENIKEEFDRLGPNDKRWIWVCALVAVAGVLFAFFIGNACSVTSSDSCSRSVRVGFFDRSGRWSRAVAAHPPAEYHPTPPRSRVHTLGQPDAARS